MVKTQEEIDAIFEEHRDILRRNDLILKFMLALAPKYRTDVYEANVLFLVEDAERLADEYIANAKIEVACISEDLNEALKEAH